MCVCVSLVRYPKHPLSNFCWRMLPGMHANLEYCLVIDGDNFANGSKIQLWKCHLAGDLQPLSASNVCH